MEKNKNNKGMGLFFIVLIASIFVVYSYENDKFFFEKNGDSSKKTNTQQTTKDKQNTSKDQDKNKTKDTDKKNTDTKDKNKKDETKKEETKKDTKTSDKKSSDTLAIATKNNKKIYTIKGDGTEKEIIDISSYTQVVYSLSNNKLYLLIDDFTPGVIDSNTKELVSSSQNVYTIGYIDLNDSSYTFNKITDVEGEGLPSSIVCVGNTIYYSFSSLKGIYKYDLNTKNSLRAFNMDNEQAIRLFYINDKELGYSISGFAGDTPVIGLINVSDSRLEEISSNAQFEYIYNNKLIYRQYVSSRDFSKWKYYEYDIATKKISPISDTVSSTASLYDSFIVPYKDSYIYAINNVLYQYKDNNSKKIYTFDGSIDTMVLISDNELNVSYGFGMDSDGESGVLNLDTKSFNKSSSLTSYNMVVYID